MESQAMPVCILWIFLMLFNMVVLAHGSTPPPPSPYCQPGTPLPNITQTGPKCHSCKDKCGSRNYCACDSNCLAYGDCCPDFKSVCPEEFKRGEPLLANFKYRHTECLHLNLRHGCFELYEYSFVSVCGTTGEICDSSYLRNLTEPNLALPVTDLDTGITYINYLCAKCNGASNITWMEPTIRCLDLFPYPNNRIIEDKEKLQEILHKHTCFVGFTGDNLKEIVLRPYCYEGENSCPPSCENNELSAQCQNGFVRDHVKGSKVYDNTFCALCNGETVEDLQCDRERTGCIPSMIPQGLSFSILFDFNPNFGLTVSQHPCPQYQARVGGTGECRQVACPSDLRLVEGACLPLNLTVNFMTFTLTFNFTKDAERALPLFMDKKLTGKIEEGIYTQLNLSMYSMYQSQVKFNAIQSVSRISENQFNISFTINVMFDADSTLSFGDDLHQIVNITDDMNDQILLCLTEAGIDLGQVKIIDNRVTFNHKPLHDCTWFVFSKDEFTFINGSLRLYVTNKLYDKSQYRKTGDQVIVCVAMTDMTAVNLDISQTLAILSLVLISLSIICLLIRIILQLVIPYYNSFTAKMHVNLCLALMLAFSMVLVSGIIGHYNLSGGVKGHDNAIVAGVGRQDYMPLVCALSGTIMYWFFMAAFMWMTVLSIDVWLKVHPIYRVERRFDDEKSLATYAFPCWLLPLVISGVVLGLDFTNIDSRFRPEFGRRLCWFNQRFALLAYFGSVVAICMLLIILFLIKAALNIPLQTEIRSTVKHNTLWIYLRLAVLMGVSWVFGFVAAFVGHEAIWIVFIILNASQGVLIFISFVLNRKVLKQCCHFKADSSASSTKMS